MLIQNSRPPWLTPLFTFRWWSIWNYSKTLTVLLPTLRFDLIFHMVFNLSDGLLRSNLNFLLRWSWLMFFWPYQKRFSVICSSGLGATVISLSHVVLSQQQTTPLPRSSLPALITQLLLSKILGLTTDIPVQLPQAGCNIQEHFFKMLMLRLSTRSKICITTFSDVYCSCEIRFGWKRMLPHLTSVFMH